MKFQKAQAKTLFLIYEIQDKNILRLLNEQAKGFSNFVRALEEGSLLSHET